MKKIDAVNEVRKIRDKQSNEITGKTTEEIIEYFRKKAGEIVEKVENTELSES